MWIFFFFFLEKFVTWIWWEKSEIYFLFFIFNNADVSNWVGKKIKTYKSNFKSRKKKLNANVKNYEISKVSIIYIYIYIQISQPPSLGHMA